MRREGEFWSLHDQYRLSIFRKISGNLFKSSSLSLVQQIEHFVFSLVLAERGGFEPPIRFPVCWFSKPVPSTTQPSLQYTSYCRGTIASCLPPSLYSRTNTKQFVFVPLSHLSNIFLFQEPHKRFRGIKQPRCFIPIRKRSVTNSGHSSLAHIILARSVPALQ